MSVGRRESGHLPRGGCFERGCLERGYLLRCSRLERVLHLGKLSVLLNDRRLEFRVLLRGDRLERFLRLGELCLCGVRFRRRGGDGHLSIGDVRVQILSQRLQLEFHARELRVSLREGRLHLLLLALDALALLHRLFKFFLGGGHLGVLLPARPLLRLRDHRLDLRLLFLRAFRRLRRLRLRCLHRRHPFRELRLQRLFLRRKILDVPLNLRVFRREFLVRRLEVPLEPVDELLSLRVELLELLHAFRALHRNLSLRPKRFERRRLRARLDEIALERFVRRAKFGGDGIRRSRL